MRSPLRTGWILGLAAVLALAAGIAARQWLPKGTGAPPAPVAPVAEPVLRDLDGKVRTLAEWRGKIIVLNFWASWCLPCREEMPEFVRLQNELGGRGLQFVGVAIDDADAVKAFLLETPVNYPILIGDEQAPDWADRLGNTLQALPFSVVFDRAGRPVKTQLGILKREALLKVIGPLLDPAAS